MNKSELLTRLRRTARPSRRAQTRFSASFVFQDIRRPSAKRALRHLVEDGSLVLVRGQLYALPADAQAARPARARRRWRDAISSAASSGIGSGRRTSCRSTVVRTRTCWCRARGVGEAEPGEMVVVEITRQAAAGQPPKGAVTEVLGLRSTSRAWTPRSSCASTTSPTSTGPKRWPRRRASAAASVRADLDGRTDFRDRIVVTIDGEHARDFDDAISIERLAERPLLAWRAHRRRRSLREGGERARSRGLRARHVRVFPRARGAHVPRGARHRRVLAQPAGGSPRAKLPDGDHRPGRGGPPRDSRRRDSQQRANDLHGRQRDPDRRGSERPAPATRRSFQRSS